MIKNSLFFLALFVCALGVSQTNLNAYKYVIVPNKYDFLKDADQFQLNSISEFLFNKKGFIAIMKDAAYPEDLKNNPCLALTSDLINDKKLFKTKFTIVLKDCNNKLVYKSKVGESREKEYKVAYNQALRNAFKSFSSINYKYEPTHDLKEDEVTEVKKNEMTTVSETMPSISDSNTVSKVLYAQPINNGFQLVDSTPKVRFKLLKTSNNNVFIVEGKEAIIYKSNENWLFEFYEKGILKQELLEIKF